MTINGQNLWYWYTCAILPTYTLLLLLGAAAIKIEDLKCDFESDSCGWKMENLERYQYESPLYPNSGPKKAQEGVFFVFMNVDQNTPNNYTGILSSKLIDPETSNVCLRFWYHMLGDGIGSLSVYANSDTKPSWKRSGNQQDVWHCAAVPFVNPVEKLSIETFKGSTLYSIIALDNIEVFVNIPCDQDDCESIGTKSTTEKSTAQDIGTTSSKDFTTKELLTTVSTNTNNLEDYLPYIAGIPAAVLVLSIVIVCVCLQRRKKKLTDEEIFELRKNRKRHQSRPYNAFPDPQVNDVIAPEEEVYDTVDERRMVDGITDTDCDYNTIGNSNKSDGDYYLTPKVDDYEEPNGMFQASPGQRSQVPSVSAMVAESDYEKPVTENTDSEDYLSPVFAL